ncbi:MAG: hypothetical protein WKF79_03910 [Nocardioides sp.]
MKELVDEVEEFLEHDGFYCLYEFSWFLRGRDSALAESTIAHMCANAYAELTRSHDLKLVWLPWPTDLAQAADADPDSVLDFDINSTGAVSAPLLAVARADPADA